MAARGTKKLAELQVAGQDPRSVGETARRRSAKIAESNRRTPRRRKHEPPLSADTSPVATFNTAPPAHPVPIGTPNVLDANDGDEHIWAERGQYWQDLGTQSEPRRATRGTRAEATPLVLTGHGVRLRIEQGALVICNGFTHYPQRRQERRFFPGDHRLPSRIVALDSDGALSLDVITWLARQAVPLVLLDWQGQVVSVLSGNVGAPDPALREAQLEARFDGQGLKLATWLITRKIEGSIETTRALPPSLARDRTLHKLHQTRDELAHRPPTDVEMLRLIEGRAALAYFSGWHMIPLRWKGIGRKPIPPEWSHAGLRQSFVSGTNRHATHPVNAMLNYAYGALESQVRIAAVAAGLDPTLGYLHASRPSRVALVYDLMEPLRPRVDRMVLDFIRSHTFAPSDVLLTERGVCRLHPQLARTVVAMTLHDQAMQDVVTSVLRKLAGG